MEKERIKSPEGVRNLMAELWKKHTSGKNTGQCHIYMVDLPEPTEEEKRIMAVNRANRKLDEDELNDALRRASEKLGGW